MEAYGKGRSSSQSSENLSLNKLVGSDVIATHKVCGKIGEARRFKKRESSNDFAKSST